MEVCENKELPFENGGIVVQLLNTFLRTFEIERTIERNDELEVRIKALEDSQRRQHDKQS